MINKKTYYSISEVSNILGIQEHTIRFWDSKLPRLSRQSGKGKSRFFSQLQINKLSQLSNLLKNNDSLSLAYEIISKNKSINTNSIIYDSNENQVDSDDNLRKITKIKAVSKKLKSLLIT